MSIEEEMTHEDLARDAADQKQAAHETEVMAEYKELFTGEDGDIREILREMADSEDGVFEKENADDRRLHGNTQSGESHSMAIKAGIRKSTNKYWRHAR